MFGGAQRCALSNVVGFDRCPSISSGGAAY
jgi:hypothetical protein